METKPEFIEDDDKCEVKIITDICDIELIDKNFKKCVEGYHLITLTGKKNETNFL
jgi:hypothetical protein